MSGPAPRNEDDIAACRDVGDGGGTLRPPVGPGFSTGFEPVGWAGRILLVLILALAAGLRLLFLWMPFWGRHHWNEGHYASTAVNFSRYGWLLQVNDMGVDFSFSPLVPWLAAACARLFGTSEASLRLPSLAFGLLTLGLVWMLARRMFGLGAHRHISLLFAAVTPGVVYLSRSLQLEAVSAFFAIGGLLAFEAWWRGGGIRRRWLLIAAVLWTVSVFAKYSMGLFAWSLLAAPFALPAGSPRRERFRILAGACLVLAVAASVSLLWIVSWPRFAAADAGLARAAGITASAGGSDFFLRAGAWSLRHVVKSFIVLPDYLTTYGALLVPFALAGMLVGYRRDLLVILAFSWVWALLMFTHPQSFTQNTYYSYPALYAWCCWGGMAAWRLLAWVRGGTHAIVGRVTAAALLLAILAGQVAILNRKFDRIEASKEYQALSAPFAPQKHRATRLNNRPTLVEDPAAFFYAGADPATVACASVQGGAPWDSVRQTRPAARLRRKMSGVEPFIEDPKYRVIAWNAFYETRLTPAIRQRFTSSGYREVSPLLFVRGD